MSNVCVFLGMKLTIIVMELSCISESFFFDISRKFQGVGSIDSRRVLSIGVVTEEFIVIPRKTFLILSVKTLESQIRNILSLILMSYGGVNPSVTTPVDSTRRDDQFKSGV